MARPNRNEVATKDMAKAVASILRKHPGTTAKSIELWGWRERDIYVSVESLRKALLGEIDPTACAVELLLVLMAYFNVEPDALGQFAAKRLRPVLAMGGNQPPTQGISRSS